MREGEQNEELIKNKLWSIALEESAFASEEFLATFNRSRALPPKAHSFREISDWTNRYDSDENSLLLRREPQPEQDRLNRMSFLALNRESLKCPSSLLPLPKKQKMELSPITMKFTTPPARPRKHRESSLQGKGENHLSFYESNYEPLSLLYESKRKRLREATRRREELELVLPASPDQQLLPKTERVSSIMRLMKKNQDIRIMRRRYNPEKERGECVRL